MSRQLQKSLIFLFHLLVITVPFTFTWVNEELFEFNKMILTYGLAVAIGICWLLRMIVEQQLLFRKTILDIPIGLFVASQILSTVFSIHPYTSFFGYYTRFHGGLLSTLTYVLLYYALVNNLHKSHVPKLIMSICLAAIGASLYAIPEHFGHSPSCWLITNGQDGGVSCWVQDVKTRVFGTFGQPNWLAAYVIMIMPMSLALFAQPRSTTLKRIFFGSTTILLFLTLLFTSSRSGMLGLAGGVGIFGIGLVLLGLRKKLTLTKVGPALGVMVLILGLAAAWFGTPFSSSLKTSPAPAVETPLQVEGVNRLEEGGTRSEEIRKIVWSGALAITRRYPLFGSGVETFAYSYYRDRPLEHNLVSEWDFLYNKAHNEFLNFLATTGVIGLATYGLLLGWYGLKSLHFLLDKRQNDLQAALLVLGLAAGVVALSISNFFGFSTVMVTILMFMYMAFFQHLVEPTTTELTADSSGKHHHESLTTTQWTGIGISLLVGIYALWSVWTFWSADYSYAQGKALLRSGYTAEGLDQLTSAIRQSPQEALFYDELASTYSALALQFAQQQDATSASQLAQAAITTSDQTLKLNPHHLNFHKTRARIFITLAELNPDFLHQASAALEQAIQLAPTDAKLVYNLALVQMALDQKDLGLQNLKKAIAMKSNYEAARVELAKQYEQAGQLTEAKTEYEYILSHITPDNKLVKEKLTTIDASLSAQRR